MTTFQHTRPPQRPRPDYRLADGTKVPSVTQALSVVAKPALIRWAWRLGTEGRDVDAERDFAADCGTLAHAMIEATLRGEKASVEGYTEEHIAVALNAWRNFRRYQAEHTIEPIELELKVVSETYRFGGTVDLYARVDGRLEVVDVKTSNGIFDEHIVQTAAYRAALEERGAQVDAVRVLQLSRDEPKYSERAETDTETAFAFFLHCLALHWLQRDLRSKVRHERAAAVQPPGGK